MYGKNFVICDHEKQYAKNLLQIFSSKHEVGIQLYLFYTMEELSRFTEQKKIHVLLISGEYPRKQREQISAEERYVLVRDHQKLPPGETGILRYQSADAIWSQIVERDNDEEDDKEKGVVSGHLKTKGRLIGVYSPVHRIGKTRFALELGKKMAEKEPVLYLNLETYSGGDVYFREKAEEHLGDLLYYIRQEKGNLGIRISTMAGQMEHLDYIYPMPYLQDLKAVKKEEWLELLEQILKECIYGKIVLDLGDSVEGLFEILKACDVVYTPYTEDSISRAKLSQYTENLRKTGLEEILEKTVQKRMKGRAATKKRKELE